MTEAVLEGAIDPHGGAEERERASSRENPPQAHMAELKHPYAGIKQKSVDTLGLSFCLPLEIWYTGWSFLFCTQLKIPRGMLTVVKGKPMFQKSTLGIQHHG